MTREKAAWWLGKWMADSQRNNWAVLPNEYEQILLDLTAPSVPCGRCGSETHQVPDCTAKVPDKLTVEGALDFEAARRMHLAGHFADAIVLAATRNLRVVEACETCGGTGVPHMFPPTAIPCPACKGTGRKP